MADKQITFGEITGLERIRGLTENQRKIISLVNCGLCQASIAKRLGFSSPYINQVIKRLETIGLIKRINTITASPGKRNYTLFYELSPELKGRIGKNLPEEPFTSCRVHNLRKKIPIINQSGPISLDKRAMYSTSWKMRGPLRHKFWFAGKSGMPSVTLDLHPGTIVGYCDKKQFIPAKNPEEAMEIGWRAIYQAVDKFVELQAKFGIKIEVPHTGTTLGKPHGGFVGRESPVMEEGVTTKDWWIDRSQEAELGPGHPELETDNKAGMTRLDNLIQVSEQVDLIKLPEMFKGMIDPLNQNVLSVMAQLQGGRPVEAMFQQAVGLLAQMMEKMNRMDDEIRALKGVK